MKVYFTFNEWHKQGLKIESKAKTFQFFILLCRAAPSQKGSEVLLFCLEHIRCVIAFIKNLLICGENFGLPALQLKDLSNGRRKCCLHRQSVQMMESVSGGQ